MLGLYCPDLPPVPGGVSDHTVVLARALAAAGGTVQVLATRGNRSSCLPVPVELIGGHRELPEAASRLGLRSVVIQYVPFLFARRGVSPGLVLAVDRLARRGVAVVLVLHELFVPFTRAAWLVTGTLQEARAENSICASAGPPGARRMTPKLRTVMPIRMGIMRSVRFMT